MNPRYGAHGVRRLALIQLSMTAVFALVSYLFTGCMGAQSAILAGVTYILPNLCYAKKLFQYQGARAAKQILNGFYKGEALKIGLSIVLFTLVFAVFNINPLIFFGVYVGMQMLIWFTPLLFT
ncbi:MAG: ATP synthase subunit I [Legionellaceae bacterium]|nr:ATP synthase subunit I [Legionellaceae bacterium]